MRVALPCVVICVSALAAAPTPEQAPSPPVTAEQLKSSKDKLKQLGTAFLNYAFANEEEKFPTNIMDKDGKQLLSWRVAILPFIKEDALAEKFKFDEPWDSEHNKKLIDLMPKLYAPVRVKAKVGETFYQTFVGKGALFEPKVKHPISNIPDGVSNTALVVEANEPVIWTKPADIPFDAKKAIPELGWMFDGQAHVLLGDGSVRLLKIDPDQKELLNLILPADGNRVDWAKLQK